MIFDLSDSDLYELQKTLNLIATKNKKQNKILKKIDDELLFRERKQINIEIDKENRSVKYNKYQGLDKRVYGSACGNSK